MLICYVLHCVFEWEFYFLSTGCRACATFCDFLECILCVDLFSLLCMLDSESPRIHTHNGSQVSLVVAVARTGEDGDDASAVDRFVAAVHHLVGTDDAGETVELAETLGDILAWGRESEVDT